MNKIRVVLGVPALGLCLFLAVLLLGSLFRPELPSEPIVYDEGLKAEMAEARAMPFPEELPQLQVPVNYREGESAAWYPKGESPLLKPLVEAGELPPVAERTGPEPVVLQGVEGIGDYGGSWSRVASSPGDVSVITWRLSCSTLFRWSPMGYPVVPHLAKGHEVSDDYREWTIYLRKGVRWSDGELFDANDILYWWEKEVLAISKKPPNWLRHMGEDAQIVKVDDYTVRVNFTQPNTRFLEELAGPFAIPYSPEHYLAKYHPIDGDPEHIRQAMEVKGINRKRALYYSLKGMFNVDMPQMWPWIYRNFRSSPPQVFVRNPYFFAVDTEGNQLPYLDRVLFQEKTLELIPLAAQAGEIGMQTRHIKFSDYTMLMEQREEGDYALLHWFPASRSEWALFPNINRRPLEGDPATTWKAEYLRKKEFRQALSLAINREKIIEAEYSGVGIPSQIEPGKQSPFHSPELQKAFTEYDPERAAAMLDALGLIQRDSEGMRTFPDGTRMTWYLDFTDFTGEGPVQFVVDDWARIGVRAVQRERARPLYTIEKTTLQHDFSIWTGESEFNPLVQARSFVPTYFEAHFAPAYGNWFAQGGLYGLVEKESDAVHPPEEGSAVLQAMKLLDETGRTVDIEERMRLVQEILSLNAEEVWSISIATPPPQLVVKRNNFRNVPEMALFGAAYATPSNAGIETYYLENSQDSEGLINASRDSILNPVREDERLNTGSGSRSGGIKPGKLIRNMIWLTIAMVVLMAAVRHPFIGRRLVVLVPSLLVTSVIGFYMIQLPPGSFVETKILELRMSGDEAQIEEVERLAESFHMDDPFWSRYARWMGFTWFTSFDKDDKGLLQGYMGRSMENGQVVNAIVGDRLLLTFFVSLGTIIFTWMTALPIAIYSAVKQYSIGDYLITFFGFIGMCVPNFLFAILLMHWSKEYLGISVTGLFSVEYAADPDWSWGKVVDLLKHIWVPIIIIGTGGTAGMIRVMRANLLDELKKPYVTTARAKGVRPMKLLLKYPVRLALNPFISGIGAIFPALVSGGAIVAIVLSLPMVGPLLLSGLMTQDLYLAASMLMMFSFLGVMGTLVSDLMLLWVDPRIRMEGRKK